MSSLYAQACTCVHVSPSTSEPVGQLTRRQIILYMSCPGRPLFHTSNFLPSIICEVGAILAMHPPATYARGDGRPLAVPVSQTPQELHPRCARCLPPQHLVQPATPQCTGHSRQPARGQSGCHGPLCGPHLRGRTQAGAHKRCATPTATHFCSGSRASPTRWQHSAPRGPTLAPAPGIPASVSGTAAWGADPPPEMTLYPPSAGTISATEPGSKNVLSPGYTASRETNTADINGGTYLRHNHRQPLHHGQD
jgi:hypothetical protein